MRNPVALTLASYRQSITNYRQHIGPSPSARHGCAGVRFHDVRHTHAAYLVSAGVQAKVIQKRLGHRSFAFAMDIYAGLLHGLEARAAELLPDLTRPVANPVGGTNAAQTGGPVAEKQQKAARRA